MQRVTWQIGGKLAYSWTNLAEKIGFAEDKIHWTQPEPQNNKILINLSCQLRLGAIICQLWIFEFRFSIPNRSGVSEDWFSENSDFAMWFPLKIKEMSREERRLASVSILDQKIDFTIYTKQDLICSNWSFSIALHHSGPVFSNFQGNSSHGHFDQDEN